MLDDLGLMVVTVLLFVLTGALAYGYGLLMGGGK